MSDKKSAFLRQISLHLFMKPAWALGTLCRKYGFLKNNFIYRNCRLYYLYFFDWLCRNKDTAVSFYSQNAERANAIINMLADKKSKKIYAGMIKFRQTHDRKDFPAHLITEEQYFINELQFGNDEVFIDGGAFTGDTIASFTRRCKNYKQIIAFEPDTANFEKLKKKYGNNRRITLMNVGLFDKTGEVRFVGGKGGESKITNQGDSTDTIQVKTIDGLGLESVSFIKMDIEGAELSALKGAEKTIIRDKPKLAICIYHSDEDMVRLAEYIHNIAPEYKLYVRQYDLFCETVLYAIAPPAVPPQR